MKCDNTNFTKNNEVLVRIESEGLMIIRETNMVDQLKYSRLNT